jgi:hypothetical protein
MHLVSLIHGLFILTTSGQLLSTCIQIDNTSYAQSPCFTPLANSLLLSIPFPITYLETLLGVIGSRPLWSQVADKLCPQ